MGKVRPLSTLNWPSVHDILKSQLQYASDCPSNAIMSEELGLWNYKDAIWVSAKDSSLWTRILVIAHCGSSGHIRSALYDVVSSQFNCVGLRSLINNFLNSCLLCAAVNGPNEISRPIGALEHSTAPAQLLHMDYLYCGESNSGDTYILVIMDDFSHLLTLTPAISCSADVVVSALLHWFSLFGIPQKIVSDQGSHFLNYTLKELSRQLQFKQSFSLVYCPWINGTVERAMREILKIFKLLNIELKLSIRDWPLLVPVLQFTLNHRPSISHGGYAPITLHSAVESSSLLNFVFRPQSTKFVKLAWDGDSWDSNLIALRQALAAMHRDVLSKNQKTRLLRQRMKRGQSIINFSPGDYVLWSRVDRRLPKHKLLVMWTGPYQITATVGTHLFEIKHLIDCSTHEVHAQRLKFYCDKDLDRTTEIQEYIMSQGSVLTVDSFLQHRWNTTSKIWELLVHWRGFSDLEDSWEPLTIMNDDVPTLVHSYVTSLDSKESAILLKVLPQVATLYFGPSQRLLSCLLNRNLPFPGFNTNAMLDSGSIYSIISKRTVRNLISISNDLLLPRDLKPPISQFLAGTNMQVTFKQSISLNIRLGPSDDKAYSFEAYRDLLSVPFLIADEDLSFIILGEDFLFEHFQLNVYDSVVSRIRHTANPSFSKRGSVAD